MDNEGIKEQYRIEEERGKAFKEGFTDGLKHKERVIERNKTLETALLEFIGYDKKWLRTEAGSKKLNNKELIQVILEQRELMKVDDSEKDRLRNQVKKPFGVTTRLKMESETLILLQGN